jgi:small subunit ribosomal protein S20
MPITKSAKKAVSASAKKKVMNQARRKNYKDAVKTVRAELDASKVSAAFKAVDKASKAGTIHKNKANRLKSRMAKAVARAKA